MFNDDVSDDIPLPPAVRVKARIRSVQHITPKFIDDFVKEPASGALLNTNSDIAEAYRKKRKSKTRLDNLEQEVQHLKEKLNTILKQIKLSDFSGIVEEKN